MKKRIISIAIVVLLFLILLFFPSKKLSTEEMNNLIVKSSILYADSLLKTDALSQQANSDYEQGITYINNLTQQRETVYKLTKELETKADKLANISRGQVAAYDAQEITNIIDQAPPGKKIKTLAKELNISAEKAFKLLKMSQQQLTAEARNQAGDTFETLENTARVIQDGCKVGLMIGGAQLAGTTRAAATALEKASLIINGADLVLQIGEDVSNIALGYNNQVAAVFGDIRKITEPSAAIVGFAGLYDAGGKISSTIDAFTYTFEQTNNIIQDNKVLGIKFKKETLEIDTLEEEEVNNRLQENNIPTQTDTIKLMENITQLVETIKENQTEMPGGEINQGEKISKEINKENKNIFGEWHVNIPVNGEIIKGGIYTINEDGTMKLEAEGQSITVTWKFIDNDTIEANDPRDGGKMIFKIKDDSIAWSQIKYGDQTVDAGGVTLTRKNNNQLTEETNEKNIKKSLAGTKWEIRDGNTQAIMEFTENDLSAGAMINGERMGNVVTMPYTYKDGVGYYGSDDPKAIQRVEIKVNGNTLTLTTKGGKSYEYHKIK